MSHKPSSWRHGRQTLVDERGVALIEFALVLPLLLLVVLGLVDFGKAFAYKNDETHLANQAARYASVNGCVPCSSANQLINAYIKGQAETNELRMRMNVAFAFTDTPSPGSPNHCVGSTVKVTMNYDYTFFKFLKLPFVSVNIGGSSSMRLEKNWGDSFSGAFRPGWPAAGTDAYTATGAAGGPC